MVTNVPISGTQTFPHSESDIRLNFNDPRRIVAAANSNGGTRTQGQFASENSGAIWNTPVYLTIPSTLADVRHADPCVDWTSDGTAWSITIGIDGTGTIQRLRCYQSLNSGATWSYVDDADGGQTAVDKQMMWVDHSPSSPFKDNIYVIWHNSGPVFVNRRTGPSGSWQTPVAISSPTETTGTGIGGDIKTNGFGDVFAFWPDTGSRNLFVRKSTDGGVTFGTSATIATTFDSFDIGVPSFASRRALIYISAGAFRTADKDLVYAVWTDLTGASGCSVSTNEPNTSVSSTCKTRIWFSRSTDGGVTWAVPRMINDQSSNNDQFNAQLAVDDSNGDLVVTYYDTVADPGRLRTHVWMQWSFDDGETWTPAEKVTTESTDETASSANAGNQYGDYNGLSGFQGEFFACWTDRRGGAREEIWGARILLPNRFLPEAPVAALSRDPNYMDIFSVSESGEVTSAWWNGNPWRSWFRVFGKTFPRLSPIAALSRNSNQMDLFVVEGRKIWNSWFTGGNWNDWGQLPDSPASAAPFEDACPLAVLSRDPHFMDVFAVDASGEVRSIWWNGNPWRAQNWFSLGEKQPPPGGSIRFTPSAPIATLSRNENHMELFIAGDDNQLWANYFDANANPPWSGWFQPLPGSEVLKPRTPIAAIRRNPNQMDLFAISHVDGKLHNAWWNGSWNNWGAVPNMPPSSNPASTSFPPFGHVAANSRDPNYMDVFAVDNNGDVRVAWWNGSWSWGTLGGMKFPRGAPIAVINRNSNQMDIFVINENRRIWSTWFTGGWSGKWIEIS